LSASYDETVGVWDLSRSTNITFLSDVHDAPVLCLSWINGIAISGDRNGMCVAWDLARGGTPVRSFQAHRGHCTAAQTAILSTNTTHSRGRRSQVFVTGGQDGYVKIWDTRQKASVAEIEAHRTDTGAGAVGDIECSGPGGDYIVSAGADKSLCVIDPRKFKTKGNLRHHRDFIYSLHVNGGLSFSGGGDGALVVHELATG